MGESSLASHSRTDWQREERRSRRPPQRGGRTFPPQRGSEQSGQELDRLSFLGSGELLDPHRAKPDLTVIDCLGAQRHDLAAAVQRVVIVHRLSTRRQRSRASTPQRRTRIRRRLGTPSREISLYMERPFSTPKNHTRPRRLTRALQQPCAGDCPCRRRVSSRSVACRWVPRRPAFGIRGCDRLRFAHACSLWYLGRVARAHRDRHGRSVAVALYLGPLRDRRLPIAHSRARCGAGAQPGHPGARLSIACRRHAPRLEPPWPRHGLGCRSGRAIGLARRKASAARYPTAYVVASVQQRPRHWPRRGV